MSDASRVRVTQNEANGGYDITLHLARESMYMAAKAAVEEAARLLAREVADKYIAEHLQDVMKAIDPAAIANMVALNVGDTVRTSIVDDAKRRLR